MKAQNIDMPFTELTEREFYSVYTKAGQPLLIKNSEEYTNNKPDNNSLTHDVSKKIDLNENACFFYWDHGDKIEKSITYDTLNKIVTIDIKWKITKALMNIRNKTLGICFKKQGENCKYLLKFQKISDLGNEYYAYPVEFINL
jgi:hypothetical protein